MERRLNEAALDGNIDALYALIQEDAHLLEHIDKLPFVDTPLHIAASAGRCSFALEIMRLKPSYARKPNQKGFCPIHLALQNRQREMVLRFLDIDKELVRVQGREGMTALHIAAEQGMEDLLAEFLVACPKSIQELTIRKETALHIAAKNFRIEALEIMLGWLERAELKSRRVLKWANDEGNTVLHIAASGNHIEMVKLLIERVDVNIKNLSGKTVLDILQDQSLLMEEELKKMLIHAGALNGESIPSPKTTAGILGKKASKFERLVILAYNMKLYMPHGDKDVVLIVAVLIATATYQAVLNPPTNEDNDSSAPTFNSSIIAFPSYSGTNL
ncbi:hypothetical protein UlMin_001490 [Ulmus minor]